MIIPKEVVRVAILDNAGVGKRLFGLLKDWKEPTEKIVREMRKGGWHE